MITKKICFIVVGKSAHINSWRGKKQRHLTADEVLGTKEGALVSRNGPKWAATVLFKTAGASGHKQTVRFLPYTPRNIEGLQCRTDVLGGRHMGPRWR